MKRCRSGRHEYAPAAAYPGCPECARERARARYYAAGGKALPPTLIERWWRWVEPDPITGCWLWTGAMFQSTGYGALRVNGRTTVAHRIGYECFNGPIPAGLVLDHLCRVRSCVNPAHLEAVTGQVNVLRGFQARSAG